MRIFAKRIQRPWRMRLARMLLGMALWMLCSMLIYRFFLYPRPLPPNAFFQVCVWQDERPLLKHYAEIEADHDALCLTDLYHEESGGLLRIVLRRTGDVVELRTYQDSMADPLEYAYRLEGGAVSPLWWRHGGMIRQMVSVMYAAVVAMVLFRMLLWLMRRRQWRVARWFDMPAPQK